MKVRGADFFFAFADEDKIDGELAASIFESLDGGKESGLRTFGIDGAAADDALPYPGFIN
jgi:hypothetical protein